MNVGDDSIENDHLRGDLYAAIANLSDGPSIQQTFERAMSGDASVVPSLLTLLNHPTPQVVEWAARILGRFGSPSVSQALKALTADPRNLVRAGVRRGLFRMGDPAAASIAANGLGDQDYIVQIASLAILEGLGDSANSTALLGYLDMPTRAVTLAAVFETLGILGDATGSTAVRDRLVLEENKQSNDWSDRGEAAMALEKLGRPDLGGKVLDRINVSTAFNLVIVARGKIRRLAAQQGVSVTGQSQVNALLTGVDVDGQKPVIDPWGQPVRGVFVSNGIFNVVSNGPDKTPNTADDISTADTFDAYDTRQFASLFGPPVP